MVVVIIMLSQDDKKTEFINKYKICNHPRCGWFGGGVFLPIILPTKLFSLFKYSQFVNFSYFREL